MPELVEVDLMVEYLNSLSLSNSLVTGVHPGNHLYLGGKEEQLLGLIINKITRKAKYIIWHTDQGILLCHNRFTGFWDSWSRPWSFDYLEFNRPPSDKDVRLKLDVQRLSYHIPSKVVAFDTLKFHDARCLAVLKWYPDVFDASQVHELRGMGPDVVKTSRLDDAFRKQEWTIEYFEQSARNSTQPIKLFLLDQKKQAGIGNIYACEALWRAAVNPFELTRNVIHKLNDIHTAVLEVMSEAFKFKVKYDKYIKVFRQATCTRCSQGIVRKEQANRGTYYCPTCQIGTTVIDNVANTA